MRYVQIREPQSGQHQSITEADGGGLVHFLATYDTPSDQIERAQNELRQIMQNPSISIRGPVAFNGGDYRVVSSVLDRSGAQERALIAMGRAPVFENSKVACSFMLPVTDAQLLTESFKMASPDVSIVFDMAFSGVVQSYDAELIVDWAAIDKNEYYREKMDVVFFDSEVEHSLKELLKTSAVKVESFGTDVAMERILELAIDKLKNLLYEPVPASDIPSERKNSLAEEIVNVLTLGLGASKTYRMKSFKSQGSTRISLRKSEVVERRYAVSFNIGYLYNFHGQDKRIFRDVVLDDPAFQQRDILLHIDGDLQGALGDFIKSATITVRKKHRNGNETLREVFLTASTLKEKGGNLMVSYPNQGDTDKLEWLSYEYQVIWNFGTDGIFQTGWQVERTPVVNLFVPYKKYRILLDGSSEILKEKGVRAVSIKIEYLFFGKIKSRQTVIRSGDVIENKYFDITLPSDETQISYSITWIMQDGTTKTQKANNETGIIWIDELPQ